MSIAFDIFHRDSASILGILCELTTSIIAPSNPTARSPKITLGPKHRL